jgi:iron complex outermembrane receptor protein
MPEIHMKMYEGKFLSMLVACLLGAAIAMPVSAQDEMETVVVTARKRDEVILDVPVAISAYNAQEIESAGILRPQDFIALTPNMTMVQTQNQGTSFIVVRGISQARNSEPSVAVLIDGVLMANPSQFNQELFDIASIEVLKGPQGALYGRNAIGGAVIITTREPADEIGGMLMAGYDSGPGYKARVSVGGPVGGSDAWKFQLSGSYLDTDGYIDNPFLGEEADPFKDLSARVKLIYQPSDAFKADFRLSFSQVDTQALYFNITEQVDDTSLPVRVNNRGENERDLMSASLKLDWALGGGTLTSITAYDTIEELLTGDQFDFLPIPQSVLFNQFGSDQAQHQWLDVEAVSQEIRYTSPAENRLRWIVGAYAIATDRFISTGNVFDNGSGIVPRVTTEPLPFFAPQFSYLSDSQDNLAWAVFGEMSYDITDRVEASFALRYDEDERENTTETPQQFIPDAIACDTIPQPPVCATTGDVRTETWDELQPKVTLRFKPNDSVSTYLSYSRGFRSGGFNQTGVGSAPNPFGVLNGINDLFDEETADTFEVGVKARFNDGRVTAGASVYHTEAEGSYFFVFDPTTSTQNLGNLDKVQYQGLEAEVQAQLTDSFEVYLRGGLTDSEIKESARAATDVGNQAPLVSEYTINLGAMWRAPVGGGGLEFFIRPDFQVIGDTWWWPDNFTKRSPVELLNLRAGVETDTWSVVAWSRNLTDEEYNAEWSPGPQFFPNPGYTNNFVFKAQPRTWGVDFTYRF